VTGYPVPKTGNAANHWCVDNLYHGLSETTLQNLYYNTPLVHRTHEWLPDDRALNMKPLQGTQFSDPEGCKAELT